jgi:hypothetical protein
MQETASETQKRKLQGPDGTRFCKTCAGFLPLEQFYPSAKAYQCKTHIRAQLAKWKKDAMANPSTKVLINLCDIFRSDGRRVFNRNTVGINHSDLDELFKSKGVKPTNEWRIMPIDPYVAWDLDNITIVSKKVRKVLVSVVKKYTQDSGKYVQVYTSLNLGQVV